MLPTFSSFFEDTDCDALLLSSYESIRYVSKFEGFSKSERDAFILLTKNAIFLFTNPLYSTEVKEKTDHLILIECAGLSGMAQKIQEIIAMHALRKIGYESDNLTVYEWKTICNRNFPNIGISLKSRRKIKKPEEINTISNACHIADQALLRILPKIKPGITEKELQFLLEYEFKKTGADRAFPSIIAFGKNAATPHHYTDETKLKKIDTILLDFGASVHGYASDMTRMIFIGKPTSSAKHMYQTVLDAQRQAEEYITRLLTSGEAIYASDVDATARDYIIEKGYDSFPHSLGHGIGLAVHESPSISPKSKDQLQEGMVFSLEPGIYIPHKKGMRIEDIYTIQNNKLMKLTHFSNALMVL